MLGTSGCSIFLDPWWEAKVRCANAVHSISDNKTHTKSAAKLDARQICQMAIIFIVCLIWCGPHLWVVSCPCFSWFFLSLIKYFTPFIVVHCSKFCQQFSHLPNSYTNTSWHFLKGTFTHESQLHIWEVLLGVFLLSIWFSGVLNSYYFFIKVAWFDLLIYTFCI